MADVRCPMCGKPNPAELEVCQFCQARLKPVTGGSPIESELPAPSQPPNSNAEPAEDVALPEWLQSLRQRQEDLPDAAEPQEEVPDWLSNLRGPADEAPRAAEDAIPDWLSGMGGETPLQAEAAPDEPEQVFL